EPLEERSIRDRRARPCFVAAGDEDRVARSRAQAIEANGLDLEPAHRPQTAAGAAREDDLVGRASQNRRRGEDLRRPAYVEGLSSGKRDDDDARHWQRIRLY